MILHTFSLLALTWAFFCFGAAATVSLLVVDDHGSPVEGLHKEDFQYAPEKANLLLEHNPDIPIAIGIVFENSSFISGVRTSNVEGLVKGILPALQPEDDVFLDSYGYAHVRFFGPGASREQAAETVARFSPRDFLSQKSFLETYNDRVMKDRQGAHSDPTDEIKAVLSAIQTLRAMPQPRKALVWVRESLQLAESVNLKKILPAEMCVFAICFSPKEAAVVSAKGGSEFFRNGVMQLLPANSSDSSILGQQVISCTRLSYQFHLTGPVKAPFPKISIKLPGMNIIGPPGLRQNVSLP